MAGERILIVEDESLIVFDLRRRLKGFGYEVVGSCSNGADAIELCRIEKPDLVLMDIMIEGVIDGIETARRVLAEYGVPSIFLTAYADDTTLQRSKVASPLAYLIKPYKERELFTTLDVALDKLRIDLKIRDQERWLGAILNSVSDGLLALTADLKIHYANPAGAALLGQEPETLVGEFHADVFSLCDEETLIPLRVIGQEQEREGTVFFHQCLLQTTEGSLYHVEGSLSKVHFDRMPVAWVLTLRDVSPVRHLSQKLEFQATHDALTGLLNRREFTSILSSVYLKKVKEGVSCFMVYLDLDQFKVVNDTSGHLAGDELLRQVADLLSAQKDQSLTAIARLGGDEFGLVLEGCGQEEALEKAWVLKHSLANHEFVWQGDRFKTKASIGVIPLSGAYEDVKSILAAADDACYQAKEEGGNRIRLYSREEDVFLKRRGEMTWIHRLQHALENDRFVLYHQLIRPLQPGSTLRPKTEILLRLRDDDDQLISPAEFIPAAERYNLMPPIDRWVISHALAGWNQFQATVSDKPLMCLNLSGQSIADPNLVSFIKNEFKKNKLDPADFCFEITETAAIATLSLALDLISDLKALGCRFALDDFGSGFSSFGYLRNLPVDDLKIDGAFVKAIDTDAVNFAFVEGIQKISKVMGLHTIGEFASTQSIVDTLVGLGVDYGQGYALAKPVPLF
jgi:diguanylate cyclase (GGDEF)-like protein/PAS domain S-box-containing protein